MTIEDKFVVGRMSKVSLFGGRYNDVPAKNDTGAYTSSIWASEIEISNDGRLKFCLFGDGSEFFTGEKIEVTEYTIRLVRSSNGQEQARYTVQIPIEMEGQKFAADFTLTARDKNRFPILIGARLLSGHFVVDVDHDAKEYRSYVGEVDAENEDDIDLRLERIRELARKDPKLFHKQHYTGEQS